MARKPTSKAEDLRVAYVPLASLKPYPRNARKHNQRQIRLLAESIKEFGWTLPVLIDAENMILAGHGRVEAAKLLGMEAVPSLRIERLNESQKRALAARSFLSKSHKLQETNKSKMLGGTKHLSS